MGLIADFFVSIKEGYSPLVVDFTAYCIGSPTYYKWHFGDGESVENVASTSHTYLKSGIYSPILEIRDHTGSDILIKNNHIIVNKSLVGSANVIVECYQNDSSNDWKFYVDESMHLVFNVGGEIYRSGTPVITDGVWTLVEFHVGSNVFYVSTIDGGRRKIPTYNISAGATGLHIEDKLVIAPNSSMKIDELRVVKREEDLLDYFRARQSTIYYLP